ncbi:MAG TPA: NifU family protein [Acidimicrobiia bacterium]|nr:NifU family protein [Acidimicrobiia bacterium]
MTETTAGVDLEKLEAALDYIRPALQSDGGDMIFHGVDDDGVVKLELLGACGTCPLSIVTLVSGIERLVMARVPGVAGVVAYSPSIPDI